MNHKPGYDCNTFEQDNIFKKFYCVDCGCDEANMIYNDPDYYKD